MRLLLCGLLLALFSAPAEARMHAPYRAHRIVPQASAPLDAFATPAAAYSMRRLRSAYSGPAIRLRRASDNAEQDIGFLGYTSFTGAPIDTVAANSFCAATTCKAAKWYDQSGNAADVSPGGADRPAFVFNCKGTLPCLRVTLAGAQYMQSVASLAVASALSLSAVGNRSAGSGVCSTAWLAFNYIFTANAFAGWTLRGAADITTNAADAAWHAAAGVLGAGAAFRVDDIENSGTAATAAGSNVIIAPWDTVAGTTCDWGETIVWNGYGLTANERAALVVNQRNFWGIP